MTYGTLPIASLSPQLLQLVRTGKVYSLAYPISPDTPHGGTAPPFSMRVHMRHGDLALEGAFSEATELIAMSAHSGTHIDALCHVSEGIGGRRILYGGVPVQEVEADAGFKELGVEKCPPLIARGVLVDMPPSLGLDVLPESCGISASELASCCHAQGIVVQQGDCVLIRTGFDRYRENDRERYLTAGAGPTPAACRWLADQGVMLVGSDTVSFEQVPSPHMGHLELIRRRGIPMLKQMCLEQIARDHVYEFLLIVLPLRIVGATASPVNPVAIC